MVMDYVSFFRNITILPMFTVFSILCFVSYYNLYAYI